MTITSRRNFGDLGEKLAARYLQNKNYEIVAKNFQNSSGRQLGEIDIIARDGKEWVFVEVKTREMRKYANTLPEENITAGKLLKLAKIANIYLNKNNLQSAPYRFDALSVWIDVGEKKAKIKHIQSL